LDFGLLLIILVILAPLLERLLKAGQKQQPPEEGGPQVPRRPGQPLPRQQPRRMPPADDEEELWALIFKMADNAVIDKLRILQRLERVEAADSEFAQHLLFRLRQADRQEMDGAERAIEEALSILSDPVDRRILTLWLTGQTQAEIGEDLDMSHAAVRKRWQVIKERLRAHLAISHD
jgi:RNA polymerase sigma factor (sigma-70 family)